jgi:hypothetical protein
MKTKLIKRPAVIVLGIIGLLVLYLFSAGPAVYGERFGSGWYSHFMGVVYAPISPLQTHSQIYSDYLMWWWKLGMGQT